MSRTVTPQIGFLGAGRMATALAQGWLRAGLILPSTCRGSDPSENARQAFATETGCQAGEDNGAIVADSNVLFLAVKPQNMAALPGEIRSAVPTRHLIVSIPAGFPAPPVPPPPAA